MSVHEAMEMLYSQFSDKVAIDKAFQMLGKRSKITVSDYKRLVQVIPKIMVMQSKQAKKDGLKRVPHIPSSVRTDNLSRSPQAANTTYNT